MTLTDLFDLETRIVARAGEQHDQIASRDRQVAERLNVDGCDRDELLAAWLAALRAQEPHESWFGARLTQAYRLVGVGLVVSGAVVGWTATAAVTAYDGTHPVNVLVFLGAMIGLQLLLLTLAAVGRCAHAVLPAGTFPEVIHPLVRSVASWWARRGRSGERAAAWEATLARIQTRRSLYRPVEHGLLFSLTQLFGVAFYTGAIASLLARIFLSDIAFGWSTTVRTEPATVAALCRLMSVPWAWLLPGAVPTPELVSATQYWRLSGGSYGGGTDLVLVGEWWPFLLACLVTYGLLVRLTLLALAAARTRWVLAHLPLDTPDVEQIVRSLRHAAVRSGATAPDASPTASAGDGIAPAETPVPSGPCALVAWRDAPVEAVVQVLADHLGLHADLRLAAGGRDYAADEEACAALTAAASRFETVVIVAEAWETPDEGFTHLVHDVRVAMTPTTRLLVALVDGEGRPLAGDTTEAQAWRRFVARLGDPWVGVEALGS